MVFPGFWGGILENSQDCKILRTTPNGFFNGISLMLITGVRSFFNTSVTGWRHASYRSRAQTTAEIKRPQ